MEDFMEPSHCKKRKHSFSHRKENKDHGRVQEANSGSPNEMQSTTSESTRSEKQDDCWPDFLSEAELDLLVSIKKLAMERFMSLEEECLQEILPPSVLRTIGILMKELVKDHVRKMVSVHESNEASEMSPSSKEDSQREV